MAATLAAYAPPPAAAANAGNAAAAVPDKLPERAVRENNKVVFKVREYLKMLGLD